MNENARIVYADIIDHPHHRSATRAHMSLHDRAAQFSAYDALAGYSDMIAEEARTTERPPDPDENALELLDRKLSQIAAALAAGERPTVTFTVFVPDGRKAGGRYEERTETVKALDSAARRVILEKKSSRSGQNESLDLSSITAISTEGDDAGRNGVSL